jgi:hypothetical protein
MTTFFSDVQNIGLGLLAGLIVYTLWLTRTGRLNSHITVHWLLFEILAFSILAAWKWLPLFGYTSNLSDRELILGLVIGALVVVAVLFLDGLVRFSRQERQIKSLAQELALLRERADRSEGQRQSKSA